MAIHPTAEVDASAQVADSAKIWNDTVVRGGAIIGDETIVGRGVYIGEGVPVGSRVKIQNSALVYEGSVLEDGVFVGPAVVLTNDLYPRAINPDGSLKSADDWDLVGVTIRYGAAVGARSVCIAPVTVGRWALVAAGSVVARDVPDYALVAGNPARQLGWVGRSGQRLREIGPGAFECPVSGERYTLSPDGLAVDDSTD